MTSRRVPGTVALLLGFTAAVGLGACGSTPLVGDGPDAGLALEGGTAGTTCRSDADCAAGLSCVKRRSGELETTVCLAGDAGASADAGVSDATSADATVGDAATDGATATDAGRDVSPGTDAAADARSEASTDAGGPPPEIVENVDAVKTLCPGLPALLRNPPTAIRTATELLNLANGGYYRLADDVDLTGLERTIAPSTNTENVVLDGAGRTIRGWSSSRAILGTVVCAVVSDLTVDHPILRGAAPPNEAGLVFARGTLVDRLYKSVLVGVRVTDVDVDVTGTNSVGGIVGFLTQSRLLASSALGGTIVTGPRVSQGSFTGGLVGSVAEDVRLKDLASTVSVTSAGYVGGVVGAARSGSDKTPIASSTFDGTLVVTDTVLSRAGGILGSGVADVSGCRTSGTIHPEAGAARATEFGGIAGYVAGTFTDDASTMSLDFAPLTGQGSAFGGLVGTLDGVVLRGRYRGTIRGAQAVGGIVGDALAGHVKESVVEAGTVLDGYVVGGIVGRPSFLSLGTFAHTETRVEDSHAHGTFTALTAIPAPGGVGGIVGANYFVSPQDDPLVVTNCYSDATLGGPRDRGGIVAAYQTATVTVTNSYFDSAAAGTTASAGGGTPVTAAQLRDVTTFAGFDFATTWAPPNGAPPKLSWE